MEIDLSQWSYAGPGHNGTTQYTQQHGLGNWVLDVNMKTGVGQLYKEGQSAGTVRIKGWGNSGGSTSASTPPSTGGNSPRDDHEAQRQRAAATKKQAEEEKTAQAAETEKVRKEKEAAAQAAAAGSGSGGGSGTSAASPTSQSDSRQTSSATRGDHSHTVHGAVDTSMDWKTIKSNGNEIVTRNEQTHTTMTHMRDGTIIEQVDGKPAYRVSGPAGGSSDNSNQSDFVSENGARSKPNRITSSASNASGADTDGLDPNLSWIITDGKGHTYTTKVGRKNDFKFADNGDLLEKSPNGNWYVAKDNSPGNDKGSSASPALASEHGVGMGFLTDHTSDSHRKLPNLHDENPNAHSDGVTTNQAVQSDVIDRALYKPSSTWHANASWEAPNADNKSVISQIAPSIDTNNVLEVRAGEHNNYLLRMKDGTYNSIDLNNGNVSGAGTWNKDQWSSSSYSGANVSGADTGPPPAPVPNPTPPPRTTLADQYSGQVDTAAIDKSLRDMGIVPAAPAAPSPTPPAAQIDPGIQAGIIANADQVFATSQRKSDEALFTLPGSDPKESPVPPTFDPPGNDFHLKHGRMLEM